MKHKKYTEAITTRNTNLRNYHLLKNLAAQATIPSFLPWLCRTYQRPNPTRKIKSALLEVSSLQRMQHCLGRMKANSASIRTAEEPIPPHWQAPNLGFESWLVGHLPPSCRVRPSSTGQGRNEGVVACAARFLSRW
jgi:hypothetical protein